MEGKWLGSAAVGPVSGPTIVLANVEGEARMVGTVCGGSGSFFGSSFILSIDLDTSGIDSSLISDAGCFGIEDEEDELELAKRRREPEASDDFGVDLPLAASRSRRERGAFC